MDTACLTPAELRELRSLASDADAAPQWLNFWEWRDSVSRRAARVNG